MVEGIIFILAKILIPAFKGIKKNGTKNWQRLSTDVDLQLGASPGPSRRIEVGVGFWLWFWFRLCIGTRRWRWRWSCSWSCRWSWRQCRLGLLRTGGIKRRQRYRLETRTPIPEPEELGSRDCDGVATWAQSILSVLMICPS